MKYRCIIFFALLPLALRAQTITIGPISKLAYCVDDSITVTYQASGTFKSDNFFTAQISDANGSFSSFTNSGHALTLNGSILAQLPDTGSHFRIRVASTDPYLTSDDNGSDLKVMAPPKPTPEPTQIMPNVDYGAAGFNGDTIFFHDLTVEAPSSTFQWKFDQDAIPAFSSDSAPAVIYPTDGLKTGTLTVTNAGGCSTSVSFKNRILSCMPIIPSTAHIVTGNETGSYPVVWVKTGGGYTLNGSSNGTANLETVFVEPGGSVTPGGQDQGLYYVKSGGSFVMSYPLGYSMVVVDSDMLIPWPRTHNGITYKCSNLQFDYSQVNSSVLPSKASEVSIHQSADALIADGNSDLNARILNLLGSEVLSKRGAGTLVVDLSNLPAGVYFAILESGEVRQVRKILVGY